MTCRVAGVALLALLALISGCADPYAATTPGTQQPPPGEQAAAPIPPQRSDAPRGRLPPTPRQALQRAATLTTTWTPRDAAGRQQRLAAISTGAARRAALQAAARLRTDPLLRNGNASSTGRLQAIALRGRHGRRTGLIVTHENLTTDGTTHAQWRVTLVTLTRHPSGWAISRWEPQP